MVFSDDLRQMMNLNLAVVGAFAGGVAGALVCASTMFAVDMLMTATTSAQVTCITSSRTGTTTCSSPHATYTGRTNELTGTTTWSGPGGSMTCRTNSLTGICN